MKNALGGSKRRLRWIWYGFDRQRKNYNGLCKLTVDGQTANTVVGAIK
jgi:hypothetical protein